MANVRVTAQEAKERARIEEARVDALTEDDIHRFNAEDGFDPDDTMAGLRRVFSPAEIRVRTGLTQREIAERLRIPVKTWRNWEQGRTTLDPAVRSFLSLVAEDAAFAFQVLGEFERPSAEAGRINVMIAEEDLEFLLRMLTTKTLEPPVEEEAKRVRRIEGEAKSNRIVGRIRKADQPSGA